LRSKGGPKLGSLLKDKIPIRLTECDTLKMGYVERAHRAHTEEFYEVTESSFDLVELSTELLHWEKIYNTLRPHQSLDYLTPQEFIRQWQQKIWKGGSVSLRYWISTPSVSNHLTR
jgi:hypothetical protein